MTELGRDSHGLLRKGCTCGHDHLTFRDEHVERCLECSCDHENVRCQNCGEEAWPVVRPTADGAHLYDACSRRCAFQIEYAVSRKVAA